MANSKLHDVQNAAWTAPIEKGVPQAYERGYAFFVPTSDWQGKAPSFYAYVTGSFMGMGTNVPAFIDGMESFGRLAQIGPNDEGHMVCHFILPPGHPDASEEEAQVIISVPCTPRMADVFLNAGVLTALDNIVYGHAEDGVLFEAVCYVEVG